MDRDTFVDRALEAAGIPILRIPAASQYDARVLVVRLEDGRRGECNSGYRVRLPSA